MANKDITETKNSGQFKCHSCVYFFHDPKMGQCHYYPQTINKAPTDWCSMHEVYVSPVIASMVTAIEDPTVFVEPVKQRGRPKKVKP